MYTDVSIQDGLNLGKSDAMVAMMVHINIKSKLTLTPKTNIKLRISTKMLSWQTADANRLSNRLRDRGYSIYAYTHEHLDPS